MESTDNVMLTVIESTDILLKTVENLALFQDRLGEELCAVRGKDISLPSNLAMLRTYVYNADKLVKIILRMNKDKTISVKNKIITMMQKQDDI